MNYIFYRIYLYYKKKDYIPTMMGIYFVFVLQVSIVFLLGVIANFLSDGFFSSKHMEKAVFWMLFSTVLVLLFLYNVLAYGKSANLKKVQGKYKSVAMNQKIKTWHIFMLPILIIVFAFLIIAAVN